MRPLLVHKNLIIPAHELSFVATRASGPGGQNVNKVASKVELRFELGKTKVLSNEVKERLQKIASRYLHEDGSLRIVSQKTRDQSRNLEEAKTKLVGIILKALVPPKPRIPTKPSFAAKQRRLKEKRQTSSKKNDRRTRDFSQ